MKLKKSLIGVAIVAALGLASFGANAAQVTSMTGSGTFTGGGQTDLDWSGTLTMDVGTAGDGLVLMISPAFSFAAPDDVSLGSVGSGLHVDDSGTVDFRNFAIGWNGNTYGIGNEADGGPGIFVPPAQVMTINQLGGGTFDIEWTGGSALGGTSWTFAGTYTTAVPIPAAAWLLGSSLLGLVGVARRKQAEAV